MYIKNFFNDLNFTKHDVVYLTVLLVFSLFLTFHLINIHYTSNIKSDPLVYLINGLIYAGMDENIISYHSNMYLSPVVCFLTSLFFRLGFVDKITIMIVTGIIGIIGVAGSYFLFNIRFNELYSFLGSVIFASLNVMMHFWANGALDVAVTSFIIITLLFFIMAVNVNPKYYIPTAICLNLAIFTKYIAFFILPVMLLYYFGKHDFFNLIDTALSNREEFKKISRNYLKSHEFKYLFISIILAAVIFICVCGVIVSYDSGLTFITQSREAIDGFTSENTKLSIAYHNETDYYFKNYALLFYNEILGDEYSFIIPLILLTGFIFSLINIYRNKSSYKFSDFKNSYLKYFIILSIIILIPLAYILYDTSHILTNICILASMVGVYSLTDKITFNKDYFNLDVMILAWFLVFSLFLSFINIKDIRYFVVVMPAVVYFILWSFENIFSKIKDNKIFKLAIFILIILLIVYSLTYSFELSFLSDERDNEDLDNVYSTLIEISPEYDDLNLSADYSYGARYGTWLLKKDVKYIKFDTLENSNSTFVISKYGRVINNYNHIYNSGNIHLYQNINYY